MGYDLRVDNQFVEAVSAIGVAVKPGEKTLIPYTMPNTLLNIPGLGGAYFIDIGEKQISGYSKKQFGVLIRYEGEECEFRYDGKGGIIDVKVNCYGQVELSADGDFVIVDLPNILIPK